MRTIGSLIGERIRERRKYLGLSEQELADLVGVSQRSISSYQSGVRTPTLKNLNKLATVLEVTPAYLLGESNDFDVSTPALNKKASSDVVNKETTLSYRATELREAVRVEYQALCPQDRMMVKTALQAALADIDDIEIREKNSTIAEQSVKTA